MLKGYASKIHGLLHLTVYCIEICKMWMRVTCIKIFEFCILKKKWILFCLEGVETWPKLGWQRWQKKEKKKKKEKELEYTKMTYLKKLNWKKE